MSTPSSSPARAVTPATIAHRRIHPAWLNTIASHVETAARRDQVGSAVLDADSVRRMVEAFHAVPDLRCDAVPRGSEGWMEVIVTYCPQEPAVPVFPEPTNQAEIATELRPTIKPPHPLFQALEEASCALFVAEERARRAMALARHFGSLPKLEHALWETYGQLYERLYDLQQLVGTASGEDSVAVVLTQKFVHGRRRASDLIDQMGGI